MRKIILTMCAIYIHTFANTSKFQLSDDELESHEYPNVSKKNIKVEIEDSTLYVKKGGLHSATWYNPHGAKTASGERFHKDSLTAAYNFCKMRSYLRVTNVSSQESIIVRVTDRMGNKNKNYIDLSKCAFDSIGNPRSGRIKVLVEEIIK